MDFIKNIFKKKWGNCDQCNKAIYFGDLYGSAKVPPDPEIQLIPKEEEFICCRSCTENGSFCFGQKYYSITKKGEMT